jgi:hypothetical protein
LKQLVLCEREIKSTGHVQKQEVERELRKRPLPVKQFLMATVAMVLLTAWSYHAIGQEPSDECLHLFMVAQMGFYHLEAVEANQCFISKVTMRSQ